ncbi:MAG: histidine kinase dimerization/phosphoacceptor domain -containing protein [Methanobacterium sp.]
MSHNKGYLNSYNVKINHYDFYNFTPAGYFILDKNGTILNVNSMGLEILGNEKSNIIKKSFNELIVQRYQYQFYKMCNNATITGLKQQFELKLIKKEGSYIWVQIEIMFKREENQFMMSIIDINERKEVERELLENERKFRISLETLLDAFAIFKTVRENNLIVDFKFEYVNEVGCRLNKKTYGEQVGYNILEIFPEFKSTKLFDEFVKVVETGHPLVKESLIYEEQLGEKKISTAFDIRAVKLGNGLAVAWRDVTERKMAEETLEKSLKEKEILLKEIHHRIKNNMQVISSLIGLQTMYTENYDIKTILKESQERVKSMAIVHEKLYGSNDLTRINFKEYIYELAMHLFNSFDASNINLKVEAEDLFLNLETAIPCGLIINELITNSIKYAFPRDYNARSRNEIYINIISGEDEATITVKDNGIGMPDDKNLENYGTLGFLIINTLINQIHGNIKMTNKKGTTFKINFPKKNKIKELN